jgi:hypothetical protein
MVAITYEDNIALLPSSLLLDVGNGTLSFAL